MKNDITYEYRVFTNRLVDVEPMEVGVCTSKVVKELKLKDKVDGRFFHTTDKDEWFFCWNGELQKLNLKGNADVNAALEKAEQLISKANTAVESAKKAAADATTAADSATAAVERIDNKADKSDVDTLSAKVDAIKIPEVPTKVSAFENDANYLTEHDISGKQDVIDDLDDIRANAKSALKEVPDEYITETELESKGYLTEHQPLDNYYTIEQIESKIEVINDTIKVINDTIGKVEEYTNTILND